MLPRRRRALDQGRARARRRAPVAERRGHQRRLGLVAAAGAGAGRRRVVVDPRRARTRRDPDPVRRPAGPARPAGRRRGLGPDVRRAERPRVHMLFRPADLERIAAGEITLAFRRWERPRVKPGSTQRTPIGVIAFDAVEVVEEISAEDARAAGFETPEQVEAAMPPRGPIHRVSLRLAGPGPAGRAARDPARRRALRAPGPDGPVDVRVPAADRRPARRCGRATSRSPSGASAWTSSATSASSRNSA